MTAILLSTCILTTPLQIGEGSWTSPDIQVIEDWQFDPFDYINPADAFLGHIYSTTSEDGFDWQAILVDEEFVLILAKEGIADQIPYQSDVHQLRFSPNGRFVLICDYQNNLLTRLDLLEHDFQTFKPFPEGINYILLTITDSGLIVAKRRSCLKLFNYDLEEVISINGLGINIYDKIVSGGSLFFVTNTTELSAYNETGRVLWTSEFPLPDKLQALKYITTDSDGLRIVVLSYQELFVLDGMIGDELFYMDFEDFFGGAWLSPSSDYLVCNFSAASGLEGDPAFGILLISEFDRMNPVIVNAESRYDSSDGYTRLTPLSVSDNGLILCLFRSNRFMGSNRFVLLSSECEPLWYTGWFCGNPYFFSYLSGRRGAIQADGSGFWFYDGSTVHFYKIQTQ